MSHIQRIIPVLTYQDLPAAHDFLVNAFGFKAGGVSHNAEGQPIHGEIQAGDTTIRLHKEMAEHQLESPRVSDVANSGLFVQVDDVDAHYERARAAGATLDSEPVDQPYGQREYGARDLEGHRWWFASPAAGPASGVMTMRENDFRRIALAMQGATEGSHMGHPDFRVKNRIFATLHDDRELGMVKLTPDQQAAFIHAHPGAFAPENGAWGRAGCTRVRLAAVDEETLGGALTLAWQNIVRRDASPKPPRRPSAKAVGQSRKL